MSYSETFDRIKRNIEPIDRSDASNMKKASKELLKLEKKHLKYKDGRYYIKKGTLLFHGSMDDNLVITSLGAGDRERINYYSDHGVYFGLDPEISLWYILEAKLNQNSQEIVKNIQNDFSKIMKRPDYPKKFNTSKIRKKYEEDEKQWGKSYREYYGKEYPKLEKKIFENSQAFGYVYVFETVKDIPVKIFEETEGPLGEYCEEDSIPCIQVQMAIRGDFQNLFMEVFIPLKYMFNETSKNNVVKSKNGYVVDLKQLYENLNNVSYNSKNSIMYEFYN